MPNDAATDLESAVSAMTWRVEPGEFILAGFADLPVPGDLAAVCRSPGQLVREGGETTLLVRADELEDLRVRHPSAVLQEDLMWVRFELPMTWEVVGFLARVTGSLALAGVPLGAVCGYSRDHLFISREYEARARAVLEEAFGPEARH